MDIEYGYNAVAESVKYDLIENGLEIDKYIDIFGYPDKYKDMKIEPQWFAQALPGMEEYTDNVRTMAEAIDLLDIKKNEAFVRDTEGYVKLTESEYEVWVDNEDFDCCRYDSVSQFLYEDLQESIGIAIEGYNKWDVEGSNLNWQGNGGSKTMTLDKADDVMAIFKSYGDCTIKLHKSDQSDDDVFTITCYHHDCPTGSFFEFTPIKEE